MIALTSFQPLSYTNLWPAISPNIARQGYYVASPDYAEKSCRPGY